MNTDRSKFKRKYATTCILIKATPLSLLFSSIIYGWTEMYETLIVWTFLSWVFASILTAIDDKNQAEFYKEQSKKRYENLKSLNNE